MAAYYRLQAEYIDRACNVVPKHETAFLCDTDPFTQDGSMEGGIEKQDTQAEERIEKNKNKKKILLISGVSLGILLVILTGLFFLVTRCSHEEAVVAAVSPTCTQEGATEWKYCALCKKVLVPCIYDELEQLPDSVDAFLKVKKSKELVYISNNDKAFVYDIKRGKEYIVFENAEDYTLKDYDSGVLIKQEIEKDSEVIKTNVYSLLTGKKLEFKKTILNFVFGLFILPPGKKHI
jgi:hypothetical protein